MTNAKIKETEHFLLQNFLFGCFFTKGSNNFYRKMKRFISHHSLLQELQQMLKSFRPLEWNILQLVLTSKI